MNFDKHRVLRSVVIALSMVLISLLAACNLETDSGSSGGSSGGTGGSGSGASSLFPAPTNGEVATVSRVIDGDTIDVILNGQEIRVRYVGMNTPERDEVCFSEATNANAALVANQTVTLVRDISDTDRFGRLLRFVWVGGVNVNAELVAQGYAEAVVFQPDSTFASQLRQLEQQATAANIGCHPTGIFNDGSNTR
jgi:endonuclease YncB( thermonuclease family)